MQHVGMQNGGGCFGGSIVIVGVTVRGVVSSRGERGCDGGGTSGGGEERRGTRRVVSSSRSSDGGRSRNGRCRNVIGCGEVVQDARTFMQAVSRDYGCFVTSAGRHRGRGGGRSGATVLLGGPRGPRLAGASWGNGRWNLAGRYQIRIRWAGSGPALQDGWIARDLGR